MTYEEITARYTVILDACKEVGIYPDYWEDPNGSTTNDYEVLARSAKYGYMWRPVFKSENNEVNEAV